MPILAYLVNSRRVVEPPNSIALTLSTSPSLVASTAVYEYFLVPVPTFTGAVTVFDLLSVKTALAPSTLTLYSPAASFTPLTDAGAEKITSYDFWPAKQRPARDNTAPRTKDFFIGFYGPFV